MCQFGLGLGTYVVLGHVNFSDGSGCKQKQLALKYHPFWGPAMLKNKMANLHLSDAFIQSDLFAICQRLHASGATRG